MKALTKLHRNLVYDNFFVFFIMGIYLVLIGSELPLIRKDYGISYGLGGWMLSMQSLGYVISGLICILLPGIIGIKKSYLLTTLTPFLGLSLMVIHGSAPFLLLGMALTGFGKGGVCLYSNQITSNVSHNDGFVLNLLQAMFATGAMAAPFLAAVCGKSWKAAFIITIFAGLLIFCHGLGIRIDHDAYKIIKYGTSNLGFARERAFWICMLFLTTYLAIEAVLMGWMVTYLFEIGGVSQQKAQLVTSLVYLAMLVGRILTSILAAKFKTTTLLLTMVFGSILFFTLMLFGKGFSLMAFGAIGVFLFMAGMYGTSLADTGDLLQSYPLCMVIFIIIPGISASILPGLVGFMADRIGIRGGMMILYGFFALLTSITLLNFCSKRRQWKKAAKTAARSYPFL